jgi:uncharacterized protein
MWIRKAFRDLIKGVDSPMPTQVVSNEEFVPRPQTPKQQEIERLIGELADVRARKLGLDRRRFMASTMGLATCFLASNRAYGQPYWDVDEAETWEPAAYDEKWPKGEYFIFDVQSHFTNGQVLNFRNLEWVRGMGFDLKDNPDAYSFRNFVKEMFFDSETEMIVISGVPGKETHRGPDGTILEGRARSAGILPSWLMSQARTELNQLAGSTRVLCQGNCAPNHYWDTVSNKPEYTALFEQMDREVKLYKINSWKWYCHTDPGRSGGGFQIDDDMSARFYEQSRKLGLKIVSVHKGYSYQSRTLGHLANPKDVEKAALQNPDLTFVIYHSALKHGPNEPNWIGKGMNEYDATTGDFEWHHVLVDIKRRNPQITNVYPEIGSFFGPLAIVHPEMAMHGMGKNIKYYGVDHVIWGTDCLWYGAPQWVIDAFKRFQISDEMCAKFGYQKITKDDKAKIFGLNAARIYGIDVKAKRRQFPADSLTKLKTAYLNDGGLRDNGAWGWVRAND